MADRWRAHGICLPPVTLNESDLSELLAGLKAGETTDTIRASLEWVLQRLIERSHRRNRRPAHGRTRRKG